MKPKATAFVFKKYRVLQDQKTVIFDYEIQFSNQSPQRFSETIALPRASKKLASKELKPFLQSLLIILGLSYYKLYIPSKVVLSFKLSKSQADFWSTVYRRGLGEFCYRNSIDPQKIATFPSSNVKVSPALMDVKDRALLGIGGGKDSIVAAELLRKADQDFHSFVIETQRKDMIGEAVTKLIDKPVLKIKRTLDPKIFESHEGSYDGHIPISAIFAFLGLLGAAAYGYKYVIVGNEHSSNFGNLEYKGEVINHQWSKTAEFEAMLQAYMRKFLTPDITYVSVLRQMYELRIAKIFAGLKKYHKTFSSCNRSYRVHKERAESLWCGECAKCAFTFLMLTPFLPKRELIAIFGKNMLDDRALIPMYRDLLGFGELKPFDCVGTFEESRAAFWIARKTYGSDAVIKALISKVKDGDKQKEQVMNMVQAPTMPTPFRFLGVESVGILGFGKEGRVTQAYLKKFYPTLRVGILDQVRDKKYLDHQDRYDLLVKTPGVHKSKVARPYVTATNIFFASVHNAIIGVTGSKGKSTTASLIYAMLKADGRKVRLVGNIGNPMLEVLLGKIDPKEIFVVELSSYMLDDIEYSPHVAVLTNLFPEHMDYHGGVESYYAAKERIFARQRLTDVTVRSPHKARIPLKQSEIPLLGEHNLRNIQAAIRAVKVFGVADAAIAQAIKTFKPLAHRLQIVGIFKGVTFIDDAISTTPESTIEALRSIPNVKTIFLGGEDRGYDFEGLEKELRRIGVEHVVLFPDTGKRVLASEKGFNVYHTRSMAQAVRFAYRVTPPGSSCLLSTASPSYSLWKNFEEKGEQFQKYVKLFSK